MESTNGVGPSLTSLADNPMQGLDGFVFFLAEADASGAPSFNFRIRF